MDRRDFLQSATLVATAGATGATGMAGTTGVLAAEAANDGALRLAQAGAASAPAAVAEAAHRGPLTRRWVEQRWVLDNIIQANGIDWDQPRSVYWNVPCGIAASADFAAIRQRVKKYADCSPAFETVARRREATARAAEEARDLVTARENYFMAAIHWGAPRNGRSTRTTSRTSPTTRRSASASRPMPGLPIIASSRCGSRSTARRCRPGSICRPAIPAAAFRWWSSFLAWTASRKPASGCMAIPT